jgi:hypothetical protein
MNRRTFVKNLAVMSAGAGLGLGSAAGQGADVTAARIPRWRGFNLQGRFGVLDSGREDVTYEDFKGHKLDRRMLELLKRY